MTEFGIGHVPAFLGGVDITSLHIRSFYRLGEFSLGEAGVTLLPRIGTVIVYNPDPDFFIITPKRYPRGYYPPTAIETGLVAGFEFKLQTFWAGLEFSSLSDDLVTVASNHAELPLRRVVTYSLSLRRPVP